MKNDPMVCSCARSGLTAAVTLFGVLLFGPAALAFDEVLPTDDVVFIHHSCGSGWLDGGLHDALLAKDYIDERNDIGYGTQMAPDAGRPASLGGVTGDNTDMGHWIRWFNDYLGRVKQHGCEDGVNRIIMFKSCYPISNVGGDGTEPGDPFIGSQTIANYKAVYRHLSGSGNTYEDDGHSYLALEDVFAANPDTLFIAVTAPPRHYAGSDDDDAHRARVFNNWLKGEWLPAYNTAHPQHRNVLVFDWFDVLAYPDDHAEHPNRLKAEYGGTTGDSHPNGTANAYSAEVFASNPNSILDVAWAAFTSGGSVNHAPELVSLGNRQCRAGETVSIAVEATDVDENELDYAATGPE